jgi:hypothetical protein
MANNRVFYACQSVNLANTLLKGVQSVGVNSTFNFEQVFQLGQVELYENIEGVPEVEFTIERALDGNSSMYTLLGGNAATPGASILAVGNADTLAILSIYPDDKQSNDSVSQAVKATGLFVSNWSCNINLDGPSTESMSLVGNHQDWAVTDNAGDTTGSETNVIKRQSLDSGSTLPYGVARLQSITASVDFGREDLQELGSKYPYFKAPTFPTEVTSEFTYLAKNDSIVIPSFDPEGSDALNDVTCKEEIIIKLNQITPNCEGTAASSLAYTINLGTKNRLTGAQYGGGDAGGGNATVTYSFSTYNELKVS